MRSLFLPPKLRIKLVFLGAESTAACALPSHGTVSDGRPVEHMVPASPALEGEKPKKSKKAKSKAKSKSKSKVSAVDEQLGREEQEEDVDEDIPLGDDGSALV